MKVWNQHEEDIPLANNRKCEDSPGDQSPGRFPPGGAGGERGAHRGHGIDKKERSRLVHDLEEILAFAFVSLY